MTALESLMGMMPNKVGENVFVTPVSSAKDKIESLPKYVWNSKTKFLDPACKNGIVLYEVYKTLMETEALIEEFPEDKDRHNHILKNQLYGVAMDGMCQLVSIRTVYGHLTPDNNILNSEELQLRVGEGFVKAIEKAFGDMKFDVVF